jgi:GTP-binding protein
VRIESVEFVVSAAGAADLPREPLPQIALVGRSNVGKSSLINALTRSRVARTSVKPGKTRLANFYRVRLARGAPVRALFLVDLPGYGYARGGAATAAEFARLTRDYFGQAGREGQAGRVAAIILAVDARHPGLDSDLAAREWIEELGIPCVVAATKIDRMTRAGRQKALQAFTALWKIPILPISAATGEGMEVLWKQIVSLASSHP